MTDARDRGAVRIAAPAKINLYLHVVGRRPDGFHLLDSLIAFAEIGDQLTLAPARELTLRIDGPFAGSLDAGDGNLIMRAARALLGDRRGLGAEIRLTKRLPVASGIGGGSADAAAALLGLRRLHGLDIGDAHLREIGFAIGADLPVCLAGVASFVGGIGERIEPAPALPAVHLVLVNPGRPLPTAAVFKRRADGPDGARFSAPARWQDSLADAAALAERLAARRNDLSEAARALLPAIDEALDRLGRQPDCLLARLSGSGATCFGLFGDEGGAARAAAAISAARPGWWVVATQLRTRPAMAELRG
ncbi:MAG: 4-(cytidine 5'-diphospho)-2-C-methyl-D-erythritol kinase [Dongiaceae bacterium]